jgi:hypothetical protein
MAMRRDISINVGAYFVYFVLIADGVRLLLV